MFLCGQHCAGDVLAGDTHVGIRSELNIVTEGAGILITVSQGGYRGQLTQFQLGLCGSQVGLQGEGAGGLQLAEARIQGQVAVAQDHYTVTDGVDFLHDMGRQDDSGFSARPLISSRMCWV